MAGCRNDNFFDMCKKTCDRSSRKRNAESDCTGDHLLRSQIRGAYAWGAGPCAMGADYYVGRSGRRYACY